MIKTNPELKFGLTDNEMIDFIKQLANAYFTIDDDDNVDYTPYMARISFRYYFFLYCVEGIEFETDLDGELENILEAIDEDEELVELYKNYLDGKYEHLQIVKQLSEISLDAYDMASFRKQRLFRENRDSLEYLLNTIADKIAGIDISTLNPKSISDTLVKSYLASDAFKINHKAGEPHEKVVVNSEN